MQEVVARFARDLFAPPQAQFKSFELSTTLWALAKLGSMEDRPSPSADAAEFSRRRLSRDHDRPASSPLPGPASLKLSLYQQFTCSDRMALNGRMRHLWTRPFSMLQGAQLEHPGGTSGI